MSAPEPGPALAAVYAQPGSRLEELLAAYGPAKAAAADAKARLEAVTSALKAELTAAAGPDARAIALSGGPGLGRLRLAWVPRWEFRVKDFKADHPVLYVQYGHQGGRWELREA